MKITILQGAFLPVPPVLGGATEKMWFALAKEFAGCGHEVVYISKAYTDMPKEEHVDGIWHRRVKGYKTPRSGLYLKLLDFLYTIRAKTKIPPDTDVIITNTFWAPIMLPIRQKKKCMVDVARMPKGQMRFYSKVIRLRANSTPVAAAIQKELDASFHTNIITIPNPLPFASFPVMDREQKKPVLLYAGRVHPEKGLETLMKAFATLTTGWILRIVGPYEITAGGGGVAYLDKLKKLAGKAKVEFLGPVFNMEQLNMLYAEASVFVYPSIAEKGETFGLAPLEAMAWGCVPIVSSLRCFGDFIKDGNNGLVFDHNDPNSVQQLQQLIIRLIEDPVLLRALSEQALKVRRTHATANIARRFLEEFDEMVLANKRVYLI